MLITNNYQPNFKAGRIDREGLELLAKRLKSGEFSNFTNRFVETHEGSSNKVTLGAMKRKPSFLSGLDACISYNENNFRHLEEGFFSGLFCHPKKFLKDLNYVIRKDLKNLAEQGHI